MGVLDNEKKDKVQDTFKNEDINTWNNIAIFIIFQLPLQQGLLRMLLDLLDQRDSCQSLCET